MITILQGDAVEQLRTLPDGSVHCCVTSPPYYGLRNYGVERQIGLEETPEKYVQKIVEVFREVRRVLRDDGTLWLNLGDSYWANRAENGEMGGLGKTAKAGREQQGRAGCGKHQSIKPKDMIGIPWRVAFALQADGWYLRSDIIWNKPNPMPESVTDRPTKSHEYIFLLTKNARYFYDADAISEPISESYANDKRPPGVIRQRFYPNSKYLTEDYGSAQFKPKHKNLMEDGQPPQTIHLNRANGQGEFECATNRNARTVWTITTQARPEAHFATFPDEIPRRCIKAGCPANGMVLDPFGGSGTTGEMARELKRDCILIEINPEYIKIMRERLRLNEQLGV